MASLYGKAGASGKGGNFVNWVIERAKKRRGTEGRWRPNHESYIHQRCSQNADGVFEARARVWFYHMVNEGYCSWYEFTEAIFDILGWDVNVERIKSSELNRLARRSAFSAMKNARLESLGLKMRHWRDALKDYLGEKGYV